MEGKNCLSVCFECGWDCEWTRKILKPKCKGKIRREKWKFKRENSWNWEYYADFPM